MRFHEAQESILLATAHVVLFDLLLMMTGSGFVGPLRSPVVMGVRAREQASSPQLSSSLGSIEHSWKVLPLSRSLSLSGTRLMSSWKEGVFRSLNRGGGVPGLPGLEAVPGELWGAS